jgi:cytochrome b involved in lipid metabolism
MKIITYEEIKNIKKNKIIIISNHKVYDVTEYLHKHPGGANTILNNVKKNNYHNYKFHSNKAKEIWKSLQIGVIKNKDNCEIL